MWRAVYGSTWPPDLSRLLAIRRSASVIPMPVSATSTTSAPLAVCTAETRTGASGGE